MPSGWRTASSGSAITLAGLEEVAKELLEHSKNRKIWLFSGEMGSGKTTLIKVIAKLLGVSEPMSSPTFPIVNEYETDHGKIYHVDLYRLMSEQEVRDIGMAEYFDSGNYCLLEWPEKLGGLLPAHCMEVRITHVDLLHRKIEYQHP
jgi:tRNA threonylcarbamoyladenosine biosynthesis protein TsaE